MNNEVLSANLEKSLEDYSFYHHNILVPALDAVQSKVSSDTLKLHEAIGYNMQVAQSIDYLLAIEKARGTDVTRKGLIMLLDDYYGTSGGIFSNGKFQLVDAANNAIKHVNLDPKRYKQVVSEYGPMDFKLLEEKDGKIFFKTKNYKFDYGRVVLRNIAKVMNFSYDEPDVILGFLDCEQCYECGDEYPDEPEFAIDRMIDYCNPVCLDCGEGERECACSEFVYGNKNGEFNADFAPGELIDSVMEQIGSSWK